MFGLHCWGCWGVGAVLGGLPASVGLVPCTRAPWKCSDVHVSSVLGLELGTKLHSQASQHTELQPPPTLLIC